MSSQPLPPMGIDTMSGESQSLREMVRGMSSPREAVSARRFRDEGKRARVVPCHAQQYLDLIGQRLRGPLRRRRSEEREHDPGQDADHRDDGHDEEKGDLGAKRVHVALS